MSYPNLSDEILDKLRELLGNPLGQSAAKLDFKPLKEDSDYLIFNNGLLYSLKVKRFLKGKIDNSGYQTYRLNIKNIFTNKMGVMLYAHRLVAEYFLQNPNNYIYVRHKDENKLNNNVDNLEWVSPKKNCQEYLNNNEIIREKPKYFEKNLENEEWKVFEQNLLYSISNKGRVRNNRTKRLLKFDYSHGGYTRVMLNDRKKYLVHRLVYSIFSNDFDLEGFVINHKDSNPSNNNFDNLEKVTYSENNFKRFKK